ncbi:hypothetical protein TELCIR_08373 [Teladorsagia circumcincta]|uniref:Uncharacterized protein n=1 Tax=Teladorsagia circumcincta TaxID=45464 RepID=A0A2G9UHS2_TELCI|nr:hypothetical protein TELCIR_08373 [Teladorsagia circumcincta]
MLTIPHPAFMGQAENYKRTFEAKLKKRKHYTFYHLVCTWKYIRWSVTVIRWAINILVGAGDYFCRCVGRKLVHFVAITSIIGALAIICAVFIGDHQLEQAWVIRCCTIAITSMTSQADISPVLPYFVLLTVSIIDCICFQVALPETKGRNLENHLPPKEERIFNRQPCVLEE